MILNENTDSCLRDTAGLVSKRHTERVRGIRKECGDAGKVERAGAQAVIIVQELPELAAELHRMPAAKAAQSVTGDKGGVTAPGWEWRRAAEIEGAAGDVHLRQSDGLGNTILY